MSVASSPAVEPSDPTEPERALQPLAHEALAHEVLPAPSDLEELAESETADERATLDALDLPDPLDALDPFTGPRVAVLLGTDRHPFDRLVSWAGTLAAEDSDEWLVQHGYTQWPDIAGRPDNVFTSKILGVDELAPLLLNAEAVVTHGGPGLIMEARAAGHVPIVVPRDPALGEHVDRHQLDFTARLAADGTIRLVRSLDELRSAVREARATGRDISVNGPRNQEMIARFGEAVEAARLAPRVPVWRWLVRRLLRR